MLMQLANLGMKNYEQRNGAFEGRASQSHECVPIDGRIYSVTFVSRKQINRWREIFPSPLEAASHGPCSGCHLRGVRRNRNIHHDIFM